MLISLSQLLDIRRDLRNKKLFEKADKVRLLIEEMFGVELADTPNKETRILRTLMTPANLTVDTTIHI